MKKIHKMNTKLSFITKPILSAMALIAISYPSYAADKVVDILPPTIQASADPSSVIEDTTHPIIRLTPDKSELIRLDSNAASIIIGNPLHVSVLAESPTILVLIPKAPGATHFTILDKNGQTIMQRHVIVASPKKDYIRIKRTCMEDSNNCQNTSVFYCPDMCHEIGLAQPDDASQQDNKSEDDTPDSDDNRQTEESE